MVGAPVVSIVIASLALLVSLVALWKTHFASGRVVSAVGSLRVHLYPFRNEKERWYISSFDTPFTLTNAGARAILITASRLRFHYPDIPIPGNREFVYPKWEIEPAKAGQISARKRFEWIDSFTKGEAMAFPLIPKETVTKHIIFETRWDDPVVQKRVDAALEVKIDGVKGWQTIGQWQIALSAATWGELTNRDLNFIRSQQFTATVSRNHTRGSSQVHGFERPNTGGRVRRIVQSLGLPDGEIIGELLGA